MDAPCFAGAFLIEADGTVELARTGCGKQKTKTAEGRLKVQ